jgi:NTF2 fold immunity protein
MSATKTDDAASSSSRRRASHSYRGMLVAALALMIASVGGSLAAQSPAVEAEHSYIPPNGFVPDRETAVRIAEAVLTPIYSAKTIRAELPLRASLASGIWTVVGTMRCARVSSCPGGVAIVEISKKDARILRVSHGK